MIKYLLDENTDPRLKKALKRAQPEMVVWRVGDVGAPILHSLDPDILIWCETNGFSLVTNNRTSMPMHLAAHLKAGRHVPGIFVLRSNTTIGQVVNELALIWATSEPDEFMDQAIYLRVNL